MMIFDIINCTLQYCLSKLIGKHYITINDGVLDIISAMVLISGLSNAVLYGIMFGIISSMTCLKNNSIKFVLVASCCIALAVLMGMDNRNSLLKETTSFFLVIRLTAVSNTLSTESA